MESHWNDFFSGKSNIPQDVLEEVRKSLAEGGKAANQQPVSIDIASMASKIDHTILALDAEPAQIDKLCDEAKEYSFAAVCVRPEYVSRAAARLKGTPVEVATVIGFHEGTYPTAAKVVEAIKAFSDGALELDVVLNRDILKSGDLAGSTIWAELHALRESCPKAVFKLILETSQLSEEEIINGCVIADITGWEYTKTSTGFCGRGASLGDVRIMSAVAEVMESRRASNEEEKGYRLGRGKMKIKASGGVRSWEDAVKMVQAGASRIGTSSGIKIFTEGKESGQ